MNGTKFYKKILKYVLKCFLIRINLLKVKKAIGKEVSVYSNAFSFLEFQDSLQKDFGAKTGEMLWNYSRGVDNREVGVIQVWKNIFVLCASTCIL